MADVTEQMTLKSSGCPSDGYGESLSCGNEKSKLSLRNFVASSTSLNLLAVDNIHSMLASKDDNHLYKRRKLDKEHNALLTDGTTTESTTRSCTTFGENSSLVQNGDGKSPAIPSNAPVPYSGENNVDSTMEHEEHAEPCSSNVCRTLLCSHSGVDDRLSSSVSSMQSSMNHEKDAGECSSPDVDATEPTAKLTSARKLCISMLKSDEFPNDGSEANSMSASVAPNDDDTTHFFECKSCGFLEDPLKMLICDSCEGAFHLSCCFPRIRKIPSEEWCCLECSKKKPKRLSGKLLSGKGGSSEHIQRCRRGLGPIGYMLIDDGPYETNVRIGVDFQAKVPEWSSPISSNDGYFDEPFELDETEASNLSCSKRSNVNKSSTANWIQCREVLDTGVVCGKWRRAPLFVTQSNNWDCSCSVLWDPIHADCAVPQELETEEVLKQLKYINTLKNRLNHCNEK